MNKPVKDHLKRLFQMWYAHQVENQNPGKSISPIDLRLSIIKPIHAQWLIEAYVYIKSRPDIVINGLKQLHGILQNKFIVY